MGWALTGRIPAARVERRGSFTRSGRTSGWAWVAEGMVGSRLSTESSGGWSLGNRCEVAPVGIGRGGGVCKLREVEAELIVGSAWAEEGCRCWSMVSFELVGAQVVDGGVPEILGRERARQGGESDAGLLQVLGHALVGEPRLCAALATTAARWRPQSSLGVAWRGEEGYNA